MKNISIIIVGLLCVSTFSIAQQVEQSNLYEFNKYKINPAYAGHSSCAQFTVGHLGQWTGFNGAPQTSYFNGNFSIGDKIGVGGKVDLDRLGGLTKFNIQGTYAYKLDFSDDHNLRFGIGAGLNQHSFDLAGSTIQDVSDESLIQGTEKGMSFYSELGLVYTIQNFELSFSVPNLIETRSNLSPTSTGQLINGRHMIGYVGYRFGDKSKVTVTPSVLYKNGTNNLHQIEGNVLLSVKETFQFGLGYRHESGILARVGFDINDILQLAYAYEFPITDISRVSSGSHEVILGVKLCGRSKPSLPKTDIVESTPPITTTDTVYVTSEPIRVMDTVIVEKLVEIKAEVKERLRLEHTIYFDQGLSSFDPAKEQEGLNKIIEYLRENRDIGIYIKGYASEEGSNYGNYKLSGERTKKVYAYLLNQGVNRGQMVSIVQGEVGSHHGADSDDENHKNRKVRIVFQEQ